MINFKQKFFFLSLQRYLSFYELIINLGIRPDDILSFIRTIGRDYPNSKKYCEKIYLTKFILPAEIMTYIYKNIDVVSVDKILSTFKVEEEYLVNMLYYYSQKYKDIFSVIVKNRELHSDLRERFNNVSIDRAHKDKKLFRNNRKNTSILKKEHKRKSIEEISLMFSCSPQIVEDELLHLGLGGFWGNENIRINYPIFINDLGNRYSKSELIFLSNNPRGKMLEDRLNTTKGNIKRALHLINKISLSPERFAKLILMDKPLCNNWIYLKELLSLKKENSSFLVDFDLNSMLSSEDRKSFVANFEHLENSISNILNNINKLKGNYIVATKKVVDNYESSYRNNSHIFFRKLGRNFVVNIDDLVYYKKIKEDSNES